MRKFIKWLIAIIGVIAIMLAALIYYLKPTEQLDMEYIPISIEDKIVQMITEFKAEVRLSRADLNAIIKQNLKQDIHEQVYIDGADFYMENSLLHGKLNVTIANSVKTELFVVYKLNWEQPNVVLQPYSLHMKSIPLPKSVMKEIEIPLEDSNQSFIQIQNIYNENEELVIALKVQLF